MTRRRGAVGLGARQKSLIYLLADGSKSVDHLVYDRMPGMDEPSIRSAITGCEKRGLVDVATVEFRYHDKRAIRVYKLTQKGREVLDQLTANEDLDDDSAPFERKEGPNA